MTKMIWTNPKTMAEIKVVVVKFYDSFNSMALVYKATASSSKYVFGVRVADCRPA